ncbi:MAG: 16S rRNA (adenine(1518)-N(6)/adenine(1519)-N(6))-dimethyltransferase RsmA [Bacteroidaceae bacterium]|nr:16S rRNA (adenine(1518)-N(6)/adenine(1519)-N(6))-dimethyltransferase RsmA [Bacteroidaceae bacterium]
MRRRDVKAKKSLGQHFLTDVSVARRIADTVDAAPTLPVLEVGPGTGALTEHLVIKGRDLRVVELDRESIAYLREHFPMLRGERLIEGDFLRMDLSRLFGGKPFVLTGNYPYNISSQIFFKVLEYKDRIPVCSGMIQKEVAERIASKPGKKAYGILSVLLQAYYDIEYLFTVDEHVFNPPPKVKSAVIRLTRNRRRQLGCDESLFKSVVKTAFNQRRKQMRNSLKTLVESQKPKVESERLEWFFTRRPEQLTVDEFIELTTIIENLKI